MKLFLLGLLLLPSLVLGQQTPSQKKYDPPFNLLDNGNFEKKVSGWTNSGGTFAHVVSGSNLIFDKGSGTFDASATAQYIQTKLYTVTEGLKGASCLGRVYYKGADANLTLQVLDGSSNVLGSSIFTASSVTVPNSVVFPCPSSGTVRLKIVSTANAAIIAVDNAHVGIADNTVQISQSTFVGSLTIPGLVSCAWSSAASGFTNFGADSDCSSSPTVTGSLAYVGSKTPGFTYTDMPPGEYLVTVSGSIGRTSAAGFVGYRISDGTISSQATSVYDTAATETASTSPSFHLSVPTAGTRNFQLQCDSGTGTCLIQNQDNPGTTAGAAPLSFHVYRFPTAQQTVYRFDTMANSWSGYHSDDCTFTTTSATFAEMAMDASCTFTQNTNTNFGTVTSYNDGTPGNNRPGIVFTPSRIGTYKVCADTAFQPTNLNYAHARLQDGAGTIISIAENFVNGADSVITIPVCGIYKATSISPVTLKILGKTSASTMFINSNVGGRTINWSIFQIDQQMPAPLLINSLVSPSVGIEVMARVSFGGAGTTQIVPTACSSDPCVISTQTASAVSSVNRNSGGDYTINFTSGTFSSPPTCVSSASTAATLVNCETFGNGVATQISVLCRQNNSPTDSAANVICMGPK